MLKYSTMKRERKNYTYGLTSKEMENKVKGLERVDGEGRKGIKGHYN